MNKDNKNNKKELDKNPGPRNIKEQEINPSSKSWEASRNPDSDNDRKGRNRDIDKENRGNEIRGREQQTSPKNTVKDVVDRFNERENKQDKD